MLLGTGRRDPLLKSNLRNIYQRIRLCVSEPLSWGSCWRRGRPSVRVSRTRTTVPRYTILARLGLTKVDHSILGSHNGHVSVNLGFSFPVNGNGELQPQDRDSTTRYMRTAPGQVSLVAGHSGCLLTTGILAECRWDQYRTMTKNGPTHLENPCQTTPRFTKCRTCHELCTSRFTTRCACHEIVLRGS